MEENQIDMWAVVELMGHGRTAGVIRTSDLGGLLRVDVPVEDSYRTEYYGAAAIYSIKVVSEEVARAYARPDRSVIAFDEPIVPRTEYEAALQKARMENRRLEQINATLRERLVSIPALPDFTDDEEPPF